MAMTGWNRRLVAVIAAVFLLEGALGYVGFGRYEREFMLERRARLESIATLESARLSQWLNERIADANILARDGEFGRAVRALLSGDEPEAAAAVLLEVEAAKLVVPAIPGENSPSAETLLVRGEGGHVMRLSRLRSAGPHADGRPVNAHDGTVAAEAVRGARGMIIGVDDAGAAVLAAIVEVPGTDWLVVSKVAMRDVLRPIRYGAAGLALVFLTVLVLAAVAMYQTVRRREAASKLRDQEERGRLAAIVESADDAIVSCDLDRRIMSWNSAAERMFGYRAAEVTGRSLAFLLPPETADDVATTNARVARGETLKSSDVVRVTKDGRRIHVSVTRSPIVDATGGVLGSARIYRDIGEQKRAVAAQERLASIVEHSNDAMITRDMEGCVTSWNAGAQRMFGYTAAEAIGRHVSFLHLPGDTPAIAGANDRLCRGEAVPAFRSERRTRNGRVIEVLVSLSPLRGPSGRVEGASLIFQDLSQLRQAELALSESEERLRAAFQQAAVGMALRAADPENSRWLRVNQKLCDMLGYTEAELLEMTTLDVTPPEDRALSVENSRRLLDGTASAYSRAKRYVRKDGKPIWVNLSLSMVRNREGAPLHVMSVVEDITERMKTEMQLARWTSFYRARTEINEAIARIKDERQLLERIAQVVAEKSGVLVAWIGMLDERTGRVHSVCSAGVAGEYGRGIDVVVDPGQAAGQGPAGRAVRDDAPCIIGDIATDPAMEHWRARAEPYGIRSAVTYPLHRCGRVCGCVCLYAAEAHFFDAELARVLSEMAADISFAMETLDRERQRREAEEQLRLSALAFASIADGVMITDAQTRIVSVNKAFTTITGYAEGEALGKTPEMLHSGKQDAGFYQAMRAQLEREGHWQGEVWNRRKDGEVYPEFLSISAVKNAQGERTHYVGVFNDISQFKAYEERLEYLAHHDPLTGLPNRTLLEDRVEVAIAAAERRQQRVALLFVDLDRFKLINDTLGHAIGDELLIAVARRLAGCVRAADTVSRHGGDEFLVLLPEIEDVSDAARIAEKLMEEIARRYTVGAHALMTTVSIGIAVYPENGEHMADLLRNADAAMYAAKELGRNRFQFFTESMNVRAAQRLSLETELRSALERGQLHLAYQPQFDLASARIVGVEALVRWRHP
jgi:diguanylate cyclase (GGDEF)-like protein/PAS domain S-box-containing protein